MYEHVLAELEILRKIHTVLDCVVSLKHTDKSSVRVKRQPHMRGLEYRDSRRT